MSIESDLRTLLLAQSSITAVVGSGNVYCGWEPQEKNLPYIVLTVMGKEGNTTLDGGTDLLQFVDFEIDCYGKTYGQAKDLCGIVRAFIKDYSGATGGTQTIGAVLIDDESDDVIAPTDGSDAKRFLTTLELTIHYNPA